MSNKKKNYVGMKGANSFGSEMVIIRSDGHYDLDIYFPEYNWITKSRRYTEFKNGKIKCPYERRTYGVGYLGEGVYLATKNRKHTKVYITWKSMLERCYNEKYLEKQPSYKDCEVCEEWLNFQNFAKWYEDNYYEIEGEKMHLDKDILTKGNKIYSPETCIFVPQTINNLLTKSDENRGKLPIGVREYNCLTGNYRSGVKFKNKPTFETFYDEHNAYLWYKLNKELILEIYAEEYKDLIPCKAYNGLKNYKVDVND